MPGLAALVDAHLGLVRTELGRFGRQVSGYSLEHLLPEHGTHLARMLVGTEGTLVTVLGATVDLVPIADAAVVMVLGYPDMAAAADAVPALLAHAPLAVEGLDARLVEVVRRHQGGVPELPAGGGWLMVEMGGDTPEQALDRARAAAADAGTTAVRVLPPGPEASAMWRIRADGAGLAGRTPSGAQAWPGWEDAAVPPERLGAYLREFEALMASHGVDGLPYGHFGDGCVHVRLDLPLAREEDVPGFRTFLEESARLVVAHGGSLSGEHGDGRARSELLTTMYPPEAIALFAAVKDLFDPTDVLNPGVVVRPAPLDGDLRRPHATPLPRRTGFAFTHDDGDLTTAVHRCVGVGKCRADTGAAGGFMCPSYLATRDEKDSTRGRARVLQEMANGALVTAGWRAPEVRDVLDLCLSCKACSSDCPAGVDMAAYKAEVLHRAYRRRLRPMNHYALGWLPRWTRLVDRLRLAPLANLAARVPPARPAGAAGRRDGPAAPDPAVRDDLVPAPVGGGAGGGAGRRGEAGSPTGTRRPVGRVGAGGLGRPAGRAVGRLVLRRVRPGRAPGGGRRAARRRLPGDRPGAGRLLRADLDLHRPARRGPAPAVAPAGGARTVRGQRCADRRGGALVHRRPALGPARAAAGRPARRRGRGRDPDAGRGAARRRGLDAAEPRQACGWSPSRTATSTR